MSFSKTLIILVTALLSVSANAVNLPSCPEMVTVSRDTENSPNLFYTGDDGASLVSHKRVKVALTRYGFYTKDGASVTQVAPDTILPTTAEYVFGPKDQILFACSYFDGAVLLHELPVGSVTSCVIRNNEKKSRSVSCH